MDKLKECPCSQKSNLLYETEVSGIKTSQCYCCGFTSNTLMKEGEPFYEEQMSTLPELYKSISWPDDKDQIWVPSYVNIDKGMVFAKGKNDTDWGWAGVLSIEVKEEEKEKFPIPGKKGEYYKTRMDLSTMKMFSQIEFMNALIYIGAA